MSLIDNLKAYFSKTSNNRESTSVPEGVCPNCWGKQEWDGEFYKKIRAQNITPEHDTYTNFIHKVAEKLDKITLKDDILLCETCHVSYKK